MELTEIIKKECVSFDMELHSKDEVFEYLANALFQTNVISSKEKFIKALYYRESLSETGIGDGIAIPHGKDGTVNEASIAFVRLLHPIKWESLDEKPIQFIFLLAIPDSNGQNNTMHIQMLSELARSLIRKDVIKKVEQVKTFEDFLAAI